MRRRRRHPWRWVGHPTAAETSRAPTLRKPRSRPHLLRRPADLSAQRPPADGAGNARHQKMGVEHAAQQLGDLGDVELDQQKGGRRQKKIPIGKSRMTMAAKATPSDMRSPLLFFFPPGEVASGGSLQQYPLINRTIRLWSDRDGASLFSTTLNRAFRQSRRKPSDRAPATGCANDAGLRSARCNRPGANGSSFRRPIPASSRREPRPRSRWYPCVHARRAAVEMVAHAGDLVRHSLSALSKVTPGGGL